MRRRSTEGAVRAPADAGVAGLAARAFVHDGPGRGHGGDVGRSAGRGCPAAGTVAGLAAGVAVELAPAGGREGDPAPRAGDGDHPRIVTPIVTARAEGQAAAARGRRAYRGQAAWGAGRGPRSRARRAPWQARAPGDPGDGGITGWPRRSL